MNITFPYNIFHVFGGSGQQTYYIGINVKELNERDIPNQNDEPPFPDKPIRLWQTRHAIQAYPHLAFVLKDEIIPTCNLFSCLQVIVVDKSDRQPGSRGVSRFGLSEDDCLQWKRLEKQLRSTAGGLFRFALKTNNVQFVKSFNPFPESCLPSAWGYGNDYSTRHEAVHALHRSFAGYQWLMALISYGIILSRTKEDNPLHPRWAIYLQDNCKFDPEFVDALKASPLNSFTRKRVGVFVLETSVDPSWASHIRYMELAFCPVYIRCHNHQSWLGPFETIMANYRPTIDMIRIASNPWSGVRPHSPCPSIMSSYDRPTSSLATTVDSNVTEFRDEEDDYEEDWPSGGPSGQLPGESMDTFFARQTMHNNRRLALMTAKEHQSVIDREQNALIRGFSGSSGKVYVWLRNSASGWIKRVRVKADVALDAYLSFNKDTRRFDPVTNSWDCYSGWAPGFKPDDSDDHSDDGSVYMQPIPSVALALPSPSGGTHASSSLTPPTSTPIDVPTPIDAPTPTDAPTPVYAPTPTDGDGDVEMGDTHSPQTSRPPSPSEYGLNDPASNVTTFTYTAPSSTLPYHIPIVQSYQEAFLDTLYFRYGFICDDASAGDEVEDGELEEMSRLDHAKCIFMAQNAELPQHYHRRFLKFAAMLCVGDTDRQLWDLDPSSPKHLPPVLTSNQNVFSIQRLDTVGYRLMPPSQQDFEERFYHLVVPQATVAIECYRRGFVSIPFAAQRLLDCGKSFRTFMSPTRDAIQTRPCFVLPHRPTGFTFQPSHYPLYKRELEFFFQYPHARAALLEGGILWRLAMEYLDPRDALDGPSESACDFGEVVHLPDGTKLVDDCLTNDERDLICCSYIVYTGAFILCLTCLDIKVIIGYGKQESEQSWWPKQSTWVAGCEYAGHWTEACEQWFQRRLRDIIGGTALPKTAGEWRKELRKGSHKTPLLNKHYESEAVRFLSAN